MNYKQKYLLSFYIFFFTFKNIAVCLFRTNRTNFMNNNLIKIVNKYLNNQIQKFFVLKYDFRLLFFNENCTQKKFAISFEQI